MWLQLISTIKTVLNLFISLLLVAWYLVLILDAKIVLVLLPLF